MQRVTTIIEVRRAVASARAAGHRIGLVPTMGALHEGHLSLAELAAEHADTVVVSVFVNPTQFDRRDDLAAYPRDLEGDEALLAGLGDLAPAMVFAPPATELYPTGPTRTRVHVAGLSAVLEGASRPGHFDGVATVVTKLCNAVGPDVAVFGRKDLQQLLVLRRMVADLDVPVTIVDGPTVREPGGLAMSSRNRLLDPQDRRRALALSRALRAAVLAAREQRAVGREVTAEPIRLAAFAVLEGAEGVTLDHLEVVDLATLRPPDGPVPGGRLAVVVAAEVGPVRLIDNVEVGDEADEARLLDATADG